MVTPRTISACKLCIWILLVQTLIAIVKVDVRVQVELRSKSSTWKNSTVSDHKPSERQRRLTINFYGGSITWANYLPQKEAFPSLVATKLLQQYNINAVVSNNGIPASGPEHWNLCGVEYADIAVSEYRINENRPHIFKDWYNILNQDTSAKRVVVLELWSWLIPPGPPSNAVQVLQEGGFLQADHSKFSVLDMSAMDKESWRTKLKDIFSWDDIPQICYESALERNQTEIDVVRQCRRENQARFLHGPAKYHERIASLLTEHIVWKVLPAMDSQQNRGGDQRKNQLSTTTHDRLCVGSWGGMGGDRVFPWNTPGVVLHNTGFRTNCDTTNRTDKISLNTNATFASNASLVLSCPEGYGDLTIGLYKKALKHDQANFTINGHPANTAAKDWNLRYYTESFTDLPVNISNVVLASPAAYLEITDIACRKLTS